MGNRDYAAVRLGGKVPLHRTRTRILRVRSRGGKRLNRLSDLVELEECFFVFGQLGSKLVRRAP